MLSENNQVIKNAQRSRFHNKIYGMKAMLDLVLTNKEGLDGERGDQ